MEAKFCVVLLLDVVCSLLLLIYLLCKFLRESKNKSVSSKHNRHRCRVAASFSSLPASYFAWGWLGFWISRYTQHNIRIVGLHSA